MSGTIIAIGNVIGGAGGGGVSPAPPGFEALKFQVDTSIPAETGPLVYKLGLYSGGTYNFQVQWGDGNTNIITAWNQTEATHTYVSSGVYNIIVTPLVAGGVDHWYFGKTTSGDGKKVTAIDAFGDAIFYANEDIFVKCENLVSISLLAVAPTFGNTVIIASFMYNNINLITADLSQWGSFTGSAFNFLIQDPASLIDNSSFSWTENVQ